MKETVLLLCVAMRGLGKDLGGLSARLLFVIWETYSPGEGMGGVLSVRGG